MPDILTQILLFMLATFLLGLVLGWVTWKFGNAASVETMATEVNFWKNNLEQARSEREGDFAKIEALTKEKENLKRRIASMEKAQKTKG